MTQFVDGDAALLFLGGLPVRLLAHQHFIDSHRQMALGDLINLIPHRVNRRLVHDALQLRTGEAVRFLRDFVQIDALLQRLVACMQLEDMTAALLVRQINLDVPVETAGTQQSAVQHLLAVGRGDQQNPRRIGRINPVHLR
ncbi:hypothetical protein D3C81_1708640 [compost metagenome]